jgi:hypothetical protein
MLIIGWGAQSQTGETGKRLFAIINRLIEIIGRTPAQAGSYQTMCGKQKRRGSHPGVLHSSPDPEPQPRFWIGT